MEKVLIKARTHPQCGAVKYGNNPDVASLNFMRYIILFSLLFASHSVHAVYTWNVSQYTYVGYEGPHAACQFWVDSHEAYHHSGYTFTGEITQSEVRTYPYYRCELLINGVEVIEGQYEPVAFRNCNVGGCGCPPTTLEQADGSCLPGDQGEGQACPALGNPINPAIGNKFQMSADYRGVGRLPLSVVRHYNSVSGKWQFIPELVPAGLWAGPIMVRADGKKIPFSSDGAGGWVPPPHTPVTLLSYTDSAGDVIAWRYTTVDQRVEDYSANGKLLSVTDPNGSSHTFSRTSSDITVTHSNGDVLVYQLDTSGRISGFATPDNETYTYAYDSGDRLLSVSYPNSGGTRIYHYEDSNFPNALTGITDENGQRFATWAYDSAGRAISSEHNGGAEKVTIDYTHIDDETDPRSVATNVLGKQTTYHFADIFGARKVTQVEGHPSTNCAAANKNYSYDANGFVASKTDWKGNTTTYVRNTKGQELSRTEASGTAEARTITTEWHPTFNLRTKVTEPDRETLYSYDANGNLLSQQTNDLTTS